MRHGIAKPLSPANPDDFHRALTSKGRKRTRRAAKGLRALVPSLGILASSPKLRARQTAQIARRVYGGASPRLVEWPELVEGDFAAVLNRLRGLDAESLNAKTVLLCGHEPHLSRFASLLAAGEAERLQLDLKKAGVCALEVDFAGSGATFSEATVSRATLRWHLAPGQLRKISKSPRR